jgi:GPN-loop GTPase
VSSIVGTGMPDFFKAMGEKKAEYGRDYKPDLEKRVRERAEEKKTEELDKLMTDMKVGGSSARRIARFKSFADKRTCSP